MPRRVGRITLAIALIAAGAAIIARTLFGVDALYYAARLWPVLLVLLGLEWLEATRAAGEGGPVRTDNTALVLLAFIALMAMTVEPKNRYPSTRLLDEIQGPAAAPGYWGPVEPLVPPEAEPVRPPVVPEDRLTELADQPVEVVRTYEAETAEATALLLRTPTGDVIVETGERLTVELRARGAGVSPQVLERYLQEVRLEANEGETLEVRAVTPEVTPVPLQLSFRVTVPEGVAVTVETASGDVRAKGMTDDLTVTTAGGSIDALGIQGRVRLVTVSGAIDLRDPAAAVEARSSSGAVKVTASTVGGAYDLASVSGPVELRLPASASVRVSARSTAGRVRGPEWLTLSERGNSGSGTLGEGTHPVTIRTSSGPIAIRVQAGEQ